MQHFPCEIGFTETVDYLIEPKDSGNFTQFSLQYVAMEEKPLGVNSFESRFGGHHKLEEREKSFYAHDQTLHCGFVKGPPGFPSTGFDFDEKDMAYMSTCRVAVSSCILGSSDFLRRPTSKRVNYFLNFFVHYIQCLTAVVQINLLLRWLNFAFTPIHHLLFLIKLIIILILSKVNWKQKLWYRVNDSFRKIK